MNFSIYISTLCLFGVALVFQDASALNIARYVSSSDCGGSQAKVTGTFNLNPSTNSDTVTLSAYNVQVDEELDSPLKAVVQIKRKLFWWWVPMPCVRGYGTCTYEDVCLEFLQSSDCPIQSGTHNVQQVLDIPSTNLPSWLVSGDYRVRIQLNKNDRQVGCNVVDFELQ